MQLAEEHELISNALSILRQCSGSVLATRGVFLITRLLEKARQHHSSSTTTKIPMEGSFAWPLENCGVIDDSQTRDVVPNNNDWSQSRRRMHSAEDSESASVVDRNSRPTSLGVADMQASDVPNVFDDMTWFANADYFPPDLGMHDNLDEFLRQLFS